MRQRVFFLFVNGSHAAWQTRHPQFNATEVKLIYWSADTRRILPQPGANPWDPVASRCTGSTCAALGCRTLSVSPTGKTTRLLNRYGAVVGQRELIAAIASFATCDSGEIVLGDVKNPLPAAGDLVTVGPRIGAGMVPTLGREIVGACKRCH